MKDVINPGENDGHVPMLGASGKAQFPAQFHSAIDVCSLSATPIKYIDPKGMVINSQNASGFFYRSNNKTYLISARHAISGLNTFTDKPISDKAYLPSEIVVWPFVREPAGFHGRKEVRLRVRSDDWVPLWKEDPEFALFRTDIAAVEVDVPFAAFIDCPNDMNEERLLSNVGVECFVLGYPNPQFADPFLPVWRRGSLAYEPSEPVDDKPMFLVDASTSPGMSGGLILQRWHGPAPLQDPTGGIQLAVTNVITSRIIGVYGGRLSHSFHLAQVGYGWYANRIPLILGA